MTHMHEPLYLRLAGHLRDEIKQGVYAPEALLPAESALAARFGLGRDAVRDALEVLRDEGLITVRRGYRPVVRPRAVREPLFLRPNESLVCRMPSRPERVRLGIAPGVPVLELRRADGHCELIPADQVEVVRAAA
ncbi:GntR family transcriptional regulator [Dactylosporangium sp. CA-092794]|uniref:GntR family transcriptional regulator n=1 Tax=Dactylosporangium sp. CA-092794 TaxID=3239929 RepID=UPI003D908242